MALVPIPPNADSALRSALQAIDRALARLLSANVDMHARRFLNADPPVSNRDFLTKSPARPARRPSKAGAGRGIASPSPVAVAAPTLALESVEGGLKIEITHPDLTLTALELSKPIPRISGFVLLHRKGSSITVIGDEDGQIDIPANASKGAGKIVWTFDVDDPLDLSSTFFFRATATRSDGKSSGLSNEVSGKPLTTLPPTTAEKPDPPTLTVKADGGDAFSGFGFGIGAAFSSDKGRGGSVKTQLQAARKKDSVWAAGAGFTAEKVYDEEHDPPPSFFKIALEESNTFRFSARIYNELALAWSDWSLPVEAEATFTAPDSGVPGPVNSFQLSSPGQDIGNAVRAEWTPPLSNANIVWVYELQLKLANWAADSEDMLGLEGITFSGSGTLEHGGLVMTDAGASFPTPNGLAGDILYLYTALNTTTGVLTDPFAYLIASNTATAITVTTAADGAKFRPPVSLTPSYAVADGWKGVAQGWVYNKMLRPEDVAVPGIPVFLGRELISGITSPVFGRVRALNGFGRGQWRYHLNTTDRTAAVAFSPAKALPGAVSSQVITAKLDTVPMNLVSGDQWVTSDASKIAKAYAVLAWDSLIYSTRLFSVDASPNNENITFNSTGSPLVAGHVTGELMLLYVKED